LSFIYIVQFITEYKWGEKDDNETADKYR
jgi:hypothetical protein